MYIPRHWHQALPVTTSLLGFYLVHNLAPTYDVVGVFITLQLLAVSHSAWIIILSYPYQKYITWVNTPDEPKIPTIESPDPLPRVNMGEWQTVNQVTSQPRFDKERNFAVTLLRMYEYDPAQVDMTEKKWVKTTKKFVRDEFVNMLHKWEGRGVIGRKSSAKNAPYVVRRWEAVRLIASGNPLI